MNKPILAVDTDLQTKMGAALIGLRGAFRDFSVAYTPVMLKSKDEHGRNLVKGKRRKRLKLLISQYRRGVL